MPVKCHDNVLGAIGNTPLIRLNRIAAGLKPGIFAKLECVNPGGSVKDRIGMRMIEDAERRGLLKPGATIVEPTSGNTGVGLALAAVIKGYKVIFVMSDKMSMEKEILLRAYGAEVVRTPAGVKSSDPRSAHQVAARMARELPNAFMPNQYDNQSNPKAHYDTTGPEIWRDTEGTVTHFVAGAGTGGTVTGVGRYLKERNPDVKVIAVDPEGSVYASRFHRKKEEAGQYKIEGIGEDYLPGALDLKALDDVMTVSDRDAFRTARRLVKEEGMLVGSSSGAAAWAALKIARGLTAKDRIVVLFPDTGRNYLSTLFNDEWMGKNGFL